MRMIIAGGWRDSREFGSCPERRMHQCGSD
jgi:hypothetical protein